MNNYSKSILIVLLLAEVFSCKKKQDEIPAPTPVTAQVQTYKCANCTKLSEGKAVNDDSNNGVYKGVIIGSSGTFKIMIQDNDTIATLNFDGNSLSLSKTYYNNNDGMVNATFANGNTVLSIYVTNNGTSASVTVTIPGHPGILTSVAKEKSNALVKCFEGTYSGTNNITGVYNLVIVSSNAYAIYKSNSGDNGKINGSISGINLTGSGGPSISISVTGTLIDEDNVDGKWNTSVVNGSWSGKRTL